MKIMSSINRNTTKYATLEEAHQARLRQNREYYQRKKLASGITERKKFGFKNLVITQDMVGKTINEARNEYNDSKKSGSNNDNHADGDVSR